MSSSAADDQKEAMMDVDVDADLAEPKEQESARDAFIDIRDWTNQLADLKISAEDRQQARNNLENYITEHNAAGFYQHLETLLPGTWVVDPARLETLRSGLQAAVEAAQAKVKEAEETQGESEVREGMLAVAQLYARSGDLKTTLEEFTKTEEKTVGMGEKIDLHFTLLRLALALQDSKLMAEEVVKTAELLERGGDWERRNQFSVYEAVHLVQTRRDIPRASRMLLKNVATFSCTQLFSFAEFVRLAVTLAVAAADRTTHREQVINNPEVLSVIDDLPGLRELAFSLYNCRYADYFGAVVQNVEIMEHDWLLGPHVGYVLRELRVVAYKQFLTSYRSVKLASMSKAFGVSVEFLDQELRRFIGVGRLNCQIDRVSGVVTTTRPGERQRQYDELVRQGDLLLDRVNKLCRIGST